jgi:hypothetical protein
VQGWELAGQGRTAKVAERLSVSAIDVLTRMRLGRPSCIRTKCKADLRMASALQLESLQFVGHQLKELREIDFLCLVVGLDIYQGSKERISSTKQTGLLHYQNAEGKRGDTGRSHLSGHQRSTELCSGSRFLSRKADRRYRIICRDRFDAAPEIHLFYLLQLFQKQNGKLVFAQVAGRIIERYSLGGRGDRIALFQSRRRVKSESITQKVVG